MSIFFTEGPKDAVAEPDFLVVYQEAKVIDGETFLMNVWDAKEAKIVKFEACSTETTEIFPIEWEYKDFDKVFRFNPDLMNPNKREGRYHWIIERLVFCSDGRGGRKLTQVADATEESPQIPLLDPSVKIPTGRMPYAERAKLREDMNRLDKRRNENIQARREATRQKFMRWVSTVKEDLAREIAERKDLIDRERQARVKAVLERRREAEEGRLRLVRLHQEREMKIEARDEDRRKRWNLGIKELQKEGKLMEEQRQQEILQAETTRRHELDMARVRARQKRANHAQLEEHRDKKYLERQHRIWEKSQVLLMERKEALLVRSREADVTDQRRRSAMHTFSLQRSQAYEVFMEKKRAREKMRADEGAYDWLDLGEKPEVPAAQKAMESSEQEAKQSKAREQLEEQRRRLKLNKHRQKIFEKNDKKRSAHEVERHEKFVETYNYNAEREKAAIVEVVQGWRTRSIATKGTVQTKANEARRKMNLRAENIQRRLEESTTIY
jgi:hypothetical protein